MYRISARTKENHMSIQEKTRKINGMQVTYYYPVISTYKYDKSKTPVWGEGFPNRADAVIEEKRMKEQLRKSPYANRLRYAITFGEVRAEWIKTRITKEEATRIRDQAYCNIYLSVFDDMDVRKITALDVQDWVTLLTEKYAPKTTNMAFNLLSQIFDYAIMPLRIIKDNPCKENIQKPSPKRRGISSEKFWVQQELKDFLAHPYTKEDLYYCMYILHSASGMRPGEVCGISIYDVELLTRRLSLNHGVDKKGNLTDLKNTGAQRTLTIPKRIIPFIEQQLEYSNVFRSTNSEYPFLFISNSGEKITPDTYCQHLQRLIQRINKSNDRVRLKPLTPYGFRHTFATLSLMNKIPIKVVADIMGVTVQTVMENYAHVIDQMSADSLELFTDTILD